MRRIYVIAAAALVTAAVPEEEPVIEMKSLTPVIYVEEIEPILGFWEKFGFEKTGEVPEGDKIGFIMYENGPVQLMYQTRASVEKDAPDMADTPMGGNLLFIEVVDIDAVEAVLEGVEIILPRRTTFYGATEIGIREPGGNAVTFAEFTAVEGG